MKYSQKIETSFDNAMLELIAAMDANPDYEWSWRCNLALVAYEAGRQADHASKQAKDFMRRASNSDNTEVTESIPVRK